MLNLLYSRVDAALYSTKAFKRGSIEMRIVGRRVSPGGHLGPKMHAGRAAQTMCFNFTLRKPSTPRLRRADISDHEKRRTQARSRRDDGHCVGGALTMFDRANGGLYAASAPSETPPVEDGKWFSDWTEETKQGIAFTGSEARHRPERRRRNARHRLLRRRRCEAGHANRTSERARARTWRH